MMRVTLLSICTLFVATGCEINELPAHRDQIDTVRVQTRVADGVELSVADPVVVAEPGYHGPADAARAASESYIITALGQRIERNLDPAATASAFEEVFAPDVARGTSWRLAGAAQPFDARILAEVEGYGIEIDALGHAEVYFRLKTRVWFEPTGALIYETWGSHRAPLFSASYGYGGYGMVPPSTYTDDPEALAAERAYNLLVLNDLTGSELRALVLSAARDAAARMARRLTDDTWR